MKSPSTAQEGATRRPRTAPGRQEEPILPEIRGHRMKIVANNCPSELRRHIASTYVVIQKYTKSYYAKKQYWAKIYEVEYSLIRNPAGRDICNEITPDPNVPKETEIKGTTRRGFVGATGDEIGLFTEAPSAEIATSLLQARLSGRILEMLSDGKSHCLPSKRKSQDVLLRHFEEEMHSHGVKFLSPPRYVAIQINFDMVGKAPVIADLPQAPATAPAEAGAALDGAAADAVPAEEETQSPPPAEAAPPAEAPPAEGEAAAPPPVEGEGAPAGDQPPQENQEGAPPPEGDGAAAPPASEGGAEAPSDAAPPPS